MFCGILDVCVSMNLVMIWSLYDFIYFKFLFRIMGYRVMFKVVGYVINLVKLVVIFIMYFMC